MEPKVPVSHLIHEAVEKAVSVDRIYWRNRIPLVEVNGLHCSDKKNYYSYQNTYTIGISMKDHQYAEYTLNEVQNLLFLESLHRIDALMPSPKWHITNIQCGSLHSQC